MPIAKHSTVRLITPVIEGEVVGADLNPDTLSIRYRVQWTDENGDLQERAFEEAQLEVVAPPPGE